jgi:outer membrane usher protein
VRLGGLQWQRNFRLQPNLVTFPVPTLSGSAAVPSTVDVLVNNIQQYSRPVEPGPFVIDNMPVITGQGEIRVVVRDALGREQVTTLPFYAVPSLLRPGLVDFSFEGGYLRRNYAIESDDYDQRLAGLGSMRTGLTDWLTIENHVEGTDGLVNGGAGGVFRLGLWGVLSASVAQSFAPGASGGQWGAGYQWSSRRLGISASTQRASSQYQTLATYGFGTPATREVSQVSLSTAIGGGGLSLGYVAVQGGGVIAGPAAETRIGTASYSLALRGKWAANTSLFHEFGGDRATGASCGLAYFFGSRVSASAAAQYREHQETTLNVQAGRSLPAEGTGPGWRLQGTSGEAASAALSAGYRLASATVEAGAADNGDADSAFASLRGAVVGMDYRRWPMLTNSIQDSFALVDTGVPNIAVLHENRPVGRSNADGLLLIPGLAAQARNQISIDARDVPLDADVGSVREFAVPLDRSGVLVKFPVARAEHAVVVLHTVKGAPVPPGAAATLNGDETFLVGYDGQAYLKGLAARNTLQVDWGGGRCSVEFEYHAVAGAQQQIGPLRCMERAR